MAISKKISFLLIGVVTTCFLLSGVLTYLSIFANVETMLGQKLELIANTGVLMIHAEDYQKVEQALLNQDKNLESLESFKKIQKVLQNIKKNNRLSEDVYTVVAPEWADGNMNFVTMSNEKTYIGNSIKTREEQYFVKTFLSDKLRDSFDKYKKIVADLAQKQEKNIHFEISKGDVFVPVLKFTGLINSCVHLFRNAVDHGIETAQERELAGKPAQAHVVLTIENIFDQTQKQEFLRLVLQDDGRGINPEMIKSKMIEKGIKNPADLNHVSAHEIIKFIFLPQFSSASYVTSLSGRGIGLDALLVSQG